MHPPPPTSTLFPYTTLFRSIWNYARSAQQIADNKNLEIPTAPGLIGRWGLRSEEHTSELQSPDHLVCRLLIDKKHWAAGFQPPVAAVGRSFHGVHDYVTFAP